MSHLESDRSRSVIEDLYCSLNNQDGEVFPAVHAKIRKEGKS